jgi:hypothetical protein
MDKGVLDGVLALIGKDLIQKVHYYIRAYNLRR